MHPRTQRAAAVAVIRTLAVALLVAFLHQLPLTANSAALAVDLPDPPGTIALVSTGVATNPQSVDVYHTPGDTVALLHGGQLVEEITIDGEGTYTVDSVSVAITFTPVLGFAGTATGVTYAVTDTYGQTSTNTYTPTVWLPDLPSAAPLFSEGVGTAPQSVTVELADGSTVMLLDGDNPVTSVGVDGEGTYTLDTGTGVITFTPVSGYSGTTAGITYIVTDAYDQTSTATYASTVFPPDPPITGHLNSTGHLDAPQSVTIERPDGATVALQDGDLLVTEFSVWPGGTYSLNPETAVITFTPWPGYFGTPTSVGYSVTDVYGQTSTGTYTPTVRDPDAPDTVPLFSTGKGIAHQYVTVEHEHSDTVAFLDGDQLVREINVDGEGIYNVDADSGVITFSPALGYIGTTDGVTYVVTDTDGDTGANTYTPTVMLPDPPTTTIAASQGTGTTPQHVTIALPQGGSVYLRDGTSLVTQLVVQDVGTYVVNPNTGQITYTPVLGYFGLPPAVSFTVTDAYGQSSTNVYLPAVRTPARPDTIALTSTGTGIAPQSVTVELADGNTLALLDHLDDLVSEITIDGVGTYQADSITGVIAFTPVLGYVGTPAAVTYGVTDPYNQTSFNTYTPTVDPGPSLRLRAPSFVRLSKQNPDLVTARCVLSNDTAKVCKVSLTTRLSGDRITIGRGTTRLTAAQRTVIVSVHLTKRGQNLAARPQGVDTTVSAEAFGITADSWLHATDATHIASSSRGTPEPTPAIRHLRLPYLE